MAFCGINEHSEGYRKQTVLDRACYGRKLMMAGLIPKDVVTFRPQPCPEEEEPGYMRKMGSPPGIGTPRAPLPHHGYYRPPIIDISGSHSPTAIDRLRREAVRAQQLVTYSAKIPNRLSSVNYKQQW